ncbi:MAG: hypothetical protein K0Q49_612 [Haloplasmataceae bacterium]|jgi:hypothetical protein|nr:hypothetical protein [Haloplasmataceae bacterium]
MEEIKYLTNENTTFYKSNGGFIGLKSGETDYKRVSLIKAFPFSFSNSFISVRDKEKNEIGIIKNIDDFSSDTKLLFVEELERRYYLPVIDKINSIKEEFGYGYWDVLTNHGNKKFTIRRDNNSFINIKDKLILIIDVDGNRYEISDYTTLDEKSFKLIELML